MNVEEKALWTSVYVAYVRGRSSFEGSSGPMMTFAGDVANRSVKDYRSALVNLKEGSKGTSRKGRALQAKKRGVTRIPIEGKGD